MNIGVDLAIAIPGYLLLEQLYCGSKTEVYRALREADRQSVVIKLLRREYPTFSELLQFRNQYAIAKNLNIPDIIRVYSLEPYRHSYALVMEDFGGISLQQYTQQHLLSLTEVLILALQLTNILYNLYQQRVIHKDIKPANILINPETKQIKLIDFSIASLLPRETQSIINPNILEGTIAYLSPEQTGRMNRGIDYRSDFYSLGVTLFELLSGQLPFISNDPMELVHCHIAKQPPILSNREEIPQVISDIVMKLMAKNAEDRYQSVLGLKYDLEKCLAEFKETGKVEYFEIGQRDVCDRFLIPEKLYGRESEVQQLLQAFERVAQGNSEMMLVAGFSGIGKTAVVNEVHKPIVRQRGYFIKGKFDQFNRNIPFSAFVQSFRDLMGQLITENDQQLQQWKTKILAALGENGQVIIEVIPELAIIIGEQPPAPELSGIAAQNRFNLLFQNFIQVFKTKEHPLVIFLDDLQWADSASLKLIQLLMNESYNGHLLLIGAYRDREVSSVHPLILTLDEIEKIGIKIQTITLENLSQLKINQLVADTLACAEELAWSLSKLVYQKTQGNPFFVTQFLKRLYQDELIQFNYQQNCWQCDISQINQQNLTDNVVELMTQQLHKLPIKTKNVLKLAACIGNQFDLKTLAIAYEKSQIETATDLWKALQEGLILPIGEVYKFYQNDRESSVIASCEESSQPPIYKFLHDRVQQAAYELIPDIQKPLKHQKIGQLLLEHTTPTEREKNIFVLVNHLNIAANLIADKTAQYELIELNLIAGRKAKNSAAYGAAVAYFNKAIELLFTDSWNHEYDLTLTLYIEAIETEYLNTNFERSQHLAKQALAQSKTLLDKISIHEVLIQAYIAQNKLHTAIETALTILEMLEVKLEYTSIENLNIVAIEGLINLPVMQDPYKLASMRILNILMAPVLIKAPHLFPSLSLTLVKFCLDYGNSPLAAFGYVIYGRTLCHTGNIDTGYQFGELALQVLDKFNAKKLRAKVLEVFNASIRPWKQHIRETITPLLQVIQDGIETGDIQFAGYAAKERCTNLFLMGESLENVNQQQLICVNLLQQLKQDYSLHYANIWRQLVLNLQARTENPLQLVGQSFDEVNILPHLLATNNNTSIFSMYLAKAILAYLLGEYADAVDECKFASSYIEAVAGFTASVTYNFYDSLVHLAYCYSLDRQAQNDILQHVSSNQEQLRKWADFAPMNCLHKFLLVEAEKMQIMGDKIEAFQLYDRAISLAKENGYIQDEAIANELAAKFYLNWGKEKIAPVYMQEAYYCYARWGAKVKVEELVKRYPQLLQPILQQQRLSLNPLETIAFPGKSLSTATSTTGSNSISDALDFISILKAAQAISSSIELDELVTNLTRVLLENSGAKKSVLILTHENTWQVKAITSINYPENSPAQIQTMLISQPLDSCEEIPINIIHYVKNTQQTVVINNLQTNIPGLIGEYILEHQPKSIFCTPIINQGHLVGILYLENKLTSEVFTTERLQVIKLLASQTAISLENAQLYQQAQQALQDLQQAQLKIVQSEKMSALGNLVAGVAHEMNNPLGFIAVSLKQAKPTIADIVEHLKLYQASLPNPGEEILDHAEEIDLDYTLEDLPKIIDAMVMACDRLKNISTSLRTFSRADKDYKVPFNIHQGIDSTILILKHRLKANEQRSAIEVITEYGNLPQIECFPGQLNQVFMNILANAIDALEESNNRRKMSGITADNNQIKITTSQENNHVRITIADNGQGMNEEIKDKIFEHLFTTKAVGKGTGLGLAIARQIVEETHAGKLTCNSILGEGTEFLIEIPV